MVKSDGVNIPIHLRENEDIVNLFWYLDPRTNSIKYLDPEIVHKYPRDDVYIWATVDQGKSLNNNYLILNYVIEDPLSPWICGDYVITGRTSICGFTHGLSDEFLEEVDDILNLLPPL
jgi:hypothetical protein